MGPYMYVVLAFIGGVIVGGLFCFFGFPKLMPNHRMQDELTRSKRELATAQRALEEYLLRSTSLFAELDKQYQQYARFMSEASSKINSHDDAYMVVQDAERREIQREVDDSVTQDAEIAYAEQTSAPDQEQMTYSENSVVTEAPQTESDTTPETNVSSGEPNELRAEKDSENKLPELAETDTFNQVDQRTHEDVLLESAVEDVNKESSKQEKI